jgi:hypothetical protein
MLLPAPRNRKWLVSLAIAAALFLCRAAVGIAQDSGRASCDVETPDRIVAVADVHGAYDRFVAILRAAGLVDDREHWSGGRAIFVQTGDVLDRGPDSRRALDLLQRMEGEALRAGGHVYALLGNHEVMRMLRDLRYVSSGEYAAFRSVESEQVRERHYLAVMTDAATRAKGAGQEFDEPAFRTAFLNLTPLGWVEMQVAFGPTGEYGRWLRERDTMVKINGIVFVHSGISPALAALGCAKINATVRSQLDALPAAFDAKQAADFLVSREDGPLWYRGLALENESAFASEVEAILLTLNARTIVTGHTTTPDGRLTTRFGGRVIQIDTGMLGGTFFPAGRAAALEIRGGQFTAIYEDKREVLIQAPVAK